MVPNQGGSVSQTLGRVRRHLILTARALLLAYSEYLEPGVLWNKHVRLTMYRTGPTAKDYLAPNVNCGEAEETWPRFFLAGG